MALQTRKLNPSEPIGTATELVHRYFRTPKYRKDRAWLEEHIGQQRLFEYNPAKPKLKVERTGKAKFGVFLFSQLLKQFASKEAANKELQKLKRNPNHDSRSFFRELLDEYDNGKLSLKDLKGFAKTLGISNTVLNKVVSAKAKKLRGNPTPAKKRTPGRVTAKTKKRTTAKKTARPRKNGILSVLATAAVGTSAALNVYDRLNKKTKTPTPAATGANRVLHHNKAGNTAYHEKEFEKLLAAIEKGDLSKKSSAKLQGKLAGYAPNDLARMIQYAELTWALEEDWQKKNKKNPALIKEVENFLLKTNGIWSRYRAGREYKRALRLQEKLERSKAKRARIEAGAKERRANKKAREQERRAVQRERQQQTRDEQRERKQQAQAERRERLADERARRADERASAKVNPTRKRTRKPHRNSPSFEAFQGRPSTKTWELVTPNGAPKTLYCLGKLFELRLKGQPNLDFRRVASGKTFYLCADEKNKQLWIAGGSIAAPNSSIKDGFSEPLAPITHIVYETKKVHLDDEKQQGYIHKFGEEGGQQPTLAIDKNGFPIIVGGSYYISDLGIGD